MNQTLLLTGVTGFIGTEILARLVLDPRQPRLKILARKKPNTSDSLLARRFREKGIPVEKIDALDWVEVSFEDEELFRKTLGALPHDSYRVLHMAAIIKPSAQNAAQTRLNEGVTKDLLDFSNERRAPFYYMSSVVAFGASRTPKIRSEKDFSSWESFNERFSYFATKRASHEHVLRESRVGGYVLCPSIVHGSLELEKNSRAHLEALRAGKLPFCPSAGANFVCLEEVAEVTIEAVLGPVPEGKPLTRLIVGNNLEFSEYFKLYQETWAEYLLSKGQDIRHVRKKFYKIPHWLSKLVGFKNRLLDKFGVQLPFMLLIEQSSFYLYFESEYAHSKPSLDKLKRALLRSFSSL
jgi:nucleoside-diphosphate-sugar epimerase